MGARRPRYTQPHTLGKTQSGGAGHPHMPSSPGPHLAAAADLGPTDPPTLGEHWIPPLFLPILGRGMGWGNASRAPGNILEAESDFPWAEQQVLVGLQEVICPQSLCPPVCEAAQNGSGGHEAQVPEHGWSHPAPQRRPCRLSVSRRKRWSPRFIYVPHRFRGGGQRAPQNNSLPRGPMSSLVPAELGPWARANRAASRQCRAPQGRRWLRTTAPRGARAPALSLAAPTELQRSWKQQKMGWAAPMLSGSVASQDLAQVLVTTGLSLKGNSGGRAGIRARSPRPGLPWPSQSAPFTLLFLPPPRTP